MHCPALLRAAAHAAARAGFVGLAGVLVMSSATVPAGAAFVPAAAPAPCTAPPIGPPVTTSTADSGFVATAPRRLVDTRIGLGAALSPIGRGCVLRVDLDAASPPDGATAAVLTITSDRAEGITFITAYGCASRRPYVSQLNPRPGDPIPGLAIVPIDSTGEACLYVDGPTDVLVDLTGWYVAGAAPLHEIRPTRVLDTRSSLRPPSLPPGQPAGGTIIHVAIGGQAVPAGADAVAATVTITRAGAATFVTAYPCSATRPGTSTVNTLAGNDRGAPALIGLDAAGELCVYVDRPADVIVDVTGWFGPDPVTTTLPLVVPGSPVGRLVSQRLADSREGIGGWSTPFASGEVRRLDLLDHTPLGTTAVQLGVIATDATSAGYVTLYPCSDKPPEASNLNFRPITPEAALVTVGLGSTGEVCVFVFGSGDIVVDLVAVFGVDSALRALATRPGLDRTVAPGQTDHSLRCPAGGGNITLEALAMPGTTVSIAGGPAGSRTRRVVALDEDELVSMTLRRPGGGVIDQRWIRCLPHDFPRLAATGVAPQAGWFRATNAAKDPTPTNITDTFAFILDEYGVPVWYKRTPYGVIGLWDDGGDGLAWRRWTGGGFPTETPPLGYELRDLDGTLTDEVELSGEPIDWHDIITLPNGHRFVLTFPTDRVVGGPARACTAFDGTMQTTNVMVDSDIVELDENGVEIARWESEDHIAEAETQLRICFDIDPDPMVTTWALDLVHINAIDRASNGDILVTGRHTNAVYRIQWSSGDIVWKLGGTDTPESLTIVSDPLGGPRAPHDGRIAPNGHITVHDNRTGPLPHQPRAIEYAVDTGAGTATLVWSYSSGNAASGSLGSVRRQADGSTVIGWGDARTPWLEHVSAAGVPTLQVNTSFSAVIYRAERVPAATYDRTVLRNLAGGTAPPAP